MQSQTIFKSYFNLTYNKAEAEEKYSNKKFKNIMIYFKAESIFLFMLGLIASISMSLIEETFNELINVMKISSYICSLYYLVAVLFSFVYKKRSILKWLNYFNYFSLVFLCNNIRHPISLLSQNSAVITYILLNLEIVLRLWWMIVGIMTFSEKFIINMVTVFVLLAIYCSSAGSLFTIIMYQSLAYTLILIVVVVFSYILEKQQKTSFYFYWKAEKKANRLSNVLENINTGYLSIKGGKVFYINSFLMRIIKKVSKSFEDNEANLNTDRNLIVRTEFEEKNIIEDIKYKRLSNTCNLNNFEDDNEINKTISQFKSELNSNCEDLLDRFTNTIKQIPGINNFTLIGDTTLETEDLESSFEIYIRHNWYDNELEFLFNDVTRTKLKEKQNAEFTYKTFFLSKVAHEFKNPLICITELINQLSDNASDFPTEENKLICENLYQIKSMSNFLLVLVKDLNYFAQTQLGKKINLEKKECDINEVLNFCKDITKSLLKKMNKFDLINFKLKIGELVPKIFVTDEWKLKQVLINLLSNAVKFTLFGEISLAVFVDDRCGINYLKFVIKDSGTGIKEEQKKNMFQPFSKGLNIHNESGSGLGLSIANEIAIQLGDTINFSSEFERGSEFWFYVLSETAEDFASRASSSIIEINNSVIVEVVENIDVNNNTNSAANPNNSVNLNISNETKKIDYAIFKTDSIYLNDKNEIFDNNHSNYKEFDRKSLDSKNYIEISKINRITSNFLKTTSFSNSTLSKKSPNCTITLTDFLINSEKLILLRSNNNFNILVTDDEILTRQSTIRNLHTISKELDMKLNIIEAEDGLETSFIVYKSLILGIKICIIFSDECMNFLNGSKSSELINEILKRKNISQIPFYLVTAFDNSLIQDYIPPCINKILCKPLTKQIAKKLITEHDSYLIQSKI